MKKGFTIIELMTVIVLLTIIFAIVMPISLSLIVETQKRADKETVSQINRITELYLAKNLSPDDLEGHSIFDEHEDEDEIFSVLINSGLLKSKPIPQNKDGHFLWSKDQQKWVYDIYEIALPPIDETENIRTYIFKDLTKDIFTFNSWSSSMGSTWSIDEIGLQTTGIDGNDLLFIGNPNEEYDIKVNFKLNSNSGQNGGIGIFFETVLETNNQNRETGYILQFDRNFSEIVLRRRVLGSESTSLGASIIFRSGNMATSTIINTNIPIRTNTAFWEADKNISIQIRNSDQINRKSITIYVDSILIVSNYVIISDIDGVNNHIGLRSWSNRPATFYSMEVEAIN
jgi:prepilin-type N-terminal cleavage/methylation domain-containing protein